MAERTKEIVIHRPFYVAVYEVNGELEVFVRLASKGDYKAIKREMWLAKKLEEEPWKILSFKVPVKVYFGV